MLLVVSVPAAAFLAWDTRAKPEDLVALFRDMRYEQASQVRKLLERHHVPFELQDGGQTVLVPAAQRAELTIEFASILRVEDDAAVNRPVFAGPGAQGEPRGAEPSGLSVSEPASAQGQARISRDIVGGIQPPK